LKSSLRLPLGLFMPVYEVGGPPGALRRTWPILPIEISLPQTLIDYLSSKGEPIPPPVSGNALIDTGASITVVDLEVISKLKISPVGVVKVQTAAGPVDQNLFPARFKLPISPSTLRLLLART